MNKLIAISFISFFIYSTSVVSSQRGIFGPEDVGNFTLSQYQRHVAPKIESFCLWPDSSKMLIPFKVDYTLSDKFHLDKETSLTSISLKNVVLCDDATYRNLLEAQKLKFLELESVQSLSKSNCLNQQTNLESLILKGVTIQNIFPAGCSLPNLPSLTHLSLTDMVLSGNPCLTSVNLRSLNLSNIRFSDGAAKAWISDNSQLEVLTLSIVASYSDVNDVRAIFNLRELKTLELKGVIVSSIDENNIKGFKNLSNLTKLYLGRSDHRNLQGVSYIIQEIQNAKGEDFEFLQID